MQAEHQAVDLDSPAGESTFRTMKFKAASAASKALGDAILVRIYPSGVDLGRRYPVSSKPMLIGRGDNCDIRLTDESVSRRHALISPDDLGYSVRDLGSMNGTFLNDAPANSGILRDGDYLKVGNTIFRFLMSGNIEAEYHEEIYRLTIVDGLTGVHNKRYLLEFLGREIVRSQRYRRPLSLVLLDIDHFKSVNDTHTHLAGDALLRSLADAVGSEVRKEELFARFGGEEFGLVLPEATAETAAQCAERIRAKVAAHPFTHDGKAIPLTISLGVAELTDDILGPDDLIRRADEALYNSKRRGRNRVTVHRPA